MPVTPDRCVSSLTFCSHRSLNKIWLLFYGVVHRFCLISGWIRVCWELYFTQVWYVSWMHKFIRFAPPTPPSITSTVWTSSTRCGYDLRECVIWVGSLCSVGGGKERRSHRPLNAKCESCLLMIPNKTCAWRFQVGTDAAQNLYLSRDQRGTSGASCGSPLG